MLQLNQQPTSKQEFREDGSIEIFDIFYTIQGEGPFAGMPAVFVRTYGCNLSSICKGCDTDYTSKKKLYNPNELSEQVLEMFPSGTLHCGKYDPCFLRRSNTCLVVITGGEPFRQNIKPFVESLVRKESIIKVQIETNGTFIPDIDMMTRHVHLVCSPKTPTISNGVSVICDHYKYILQEGKVDKEDGLPIESLYSGIKPYRCNNWRHIWVQPMDEGDEERNKLNIQAAVESCMKYGYRLSLQLHKIIGLP